MTFEQTNVTPHANIASALSAGASTFAPLPPSVGGAADDAGDILGSIAPGGVTDDRQPEFRGQGTPGDTIVIRDNGTEIGTTEVAEDGTWTFTPSTDLLEGLHAITIVARDSTGNESAPSPAFNFEIDVTPPDASRLAITGVADNVGGVTGNVASGATTDDTHPLLSGYSTGVPGHTVTVMVRDAAGTRELGQATIGENGQWTFQVDTPLAAGPNTFTLVERDAAGNETMPTGRYTVNVVTDKPSAPVIESVFDDVGTPHMLQPGEATDDARPTLAGTAQANHTVKFYDGSTLLGQVVADASGKWSFTPPTSLTDGAHGITATSTSPLGQTSEASGSWNFVVDTTPPAKPTIVSVVDDVGPVTGNVSKDGFTNDTKPALSGKAEANSTVVIYDNGVELAKVTANASGDWTFTPATALSQGAHNITVVAVDKAGNTSVASDAFGFTVDTLAPVKPTIVSVVDDVAPVTGNVSKDGFTNDTRPALSGKAEANSTVVIYDKGVELTKVTANASGDWTWTPATALSQGAHSITVTAVDKAGNTSATSDAFGFTVDTVAPTQTATVSVIGKDSGFSEADYLTNDGSAGRLLQGKLSAALGAGETLQVSTDGGVTWKAAFVSGIAWSAQDDSSHAGNWTVQTQVVDAAGNVGAVQSQAMALDAAAPVAPTKVVQVGTDLEVQFNAANVAAGHKISLKLGGDYYEYTLTAADIAAGKALITNPAMIKFNDLPSGAVGLSLTTGDVTITSSSEMKITGGTLDGRVLMPGGSNANFTTSYQFSSGKSAVSFFMYGHNGTGDIKFYDVSGNLLGSLPAAAGNWQKFSFEAPAGKTIGHFVVTAIGDLEGHWIDNLSALPPLPDISAAMVDPAGNASQYWTSAGLKDPAASQTLTAASVGTVHGGSGNNEFVVSDVKHLADSAISGNGGTDTLKLTGANQLLDLIALGHKVSSVEIIDITGTGNNTLALSLADVMENGAMNQFVTNGRVQMMVKGNAGDKVSLMDVLPNGTDPGDWVKGANVTVGGVVYEVYQHSGFKADLLVQQGVAVTLQISIDQVMDDAGAITGPIANGGFTDDTTPTLTGKAIAGGTVKIYDGNTLLGQAVVNASGNWSYTPDTPLGEGLHSLRASVTPAGGSESARTAAFDLTVDRTAPTKPTIVSVMDDVGSVVGKVALNGTTDDARPDFTGKAEANSTVVIYDKGVKLMQVQADASGNWSWTPATALGNGVHTITVTAVDKAGNASVASDAFGFTVATTPPGKPTIVSVIDDVEAITGAIASGTTTNDAKPTFSGKADANGTVIIYDNGVEIDRVQANASGNWTYTPAKALGEGAHSITVAGADQAGNTSAPSGAFEFTVDTAPPVLAQGGIYLSYAHLWYWWALDIPVAENPGVKDAARVVIRYVENNIEKDYYLQVTEGHRDGTITSVWRDLPIPAGIPIKVAFEDAAGNLTAFVSVPVNKTSHFWAYPAGTFGVFEPVEMTDDNIIDSPAQVYTESDETFIAKLGFADRLAGGAGNDTFMKVGTGDTVHGGAGDDVIRVHSGDFAHIDGGLGIDTLVMHGKAMHIDLSALGPKVQGVEKFDLGSGGNTLALSTHDVLAGGAHDMVVADGKVQMLVNGANGEVDLLGGTHGDDGWTQGSNATVGGVTYHVYTNLAGTAELLVEDKVHVTIL